MTASRRKIAAFGITLDALTMDEAVQFCLKEAKQRSSICSYVVTPNVDHIVKLQRNRAFRQAYKAARLILVDGKPISIALWLIGCGIVQTVPGSDLVPAIFSSVNAEPLTVFLLGAQPGIAARAANRIAAQWNRIRIVGYYSPPMGFEADCSESRKIHKMINEADPDLLIVGLGAPKQEIWIHKNADKIHAGIALCVGATIDFLASEKRRAPLWMRKIGLEWFHRLISEPKRLATRYLMDAYCFPVIVAKELIYKITAY